jgi:hypothetical protein
MQDENNHKLNISRNNSLLSTRKNPKFEQIRQNHDENSKSYNERVKNMGQSFVSKSNLQMKRVFLVIVAFICGPQLVLVIAYQHNELLAVIQETCKMKIIIN